jgi:hypothetical protein
MVGIIGVTFIKNGYSQAMKGKLIKVIIEYEEFTTVTAEAVKCEFFEDAFHESIKKMEIDNSNELNMLSTYRRKFIIIKSQPKSVDIRVVIRFSFEHSTDEYCMDRFGVFVDCRNKTFLTNKRLSDFIKKNISHKIACSVTSRIDKIESLQQDNT